MRLCKSIIPFAALADFAVDLAVGVALGDAVALVVLLFALCQCQFDLGALAFLYIHPERDERQALLARLLKELQDLALVSE